MLCSINSTRHPHFSLGRDYPVQMNEITEIAHWAVYAISISNNEHWCNCCFVPSIEWLSWAGGIPQQKLIHLFFSFSSRLFWKLGNAIENKSSSCGCCCFVTYLFHSLAHTHIHDRKMLMHFRECHRDFHVHTRSECALTMLIAFMDFQIKTFETNATQMAMLSEREEQGKINKNGNLWVAKPWTYDDFKLKIDGGIMHHTININFPLDNRRASLCAPELIQSQMVFINFTDTNFLPFAEICLLSPSLWNECRGNRSRYQFKN